MDTDERDMVTKTQICVRNYFLHHKVQRLLFPCPTDPSPFSPVIGAEFPPLPSRGTAYIAV